jgi:hypothetical protein
LTGDLDFWARLALAVLATWRITHLLVREDGPWDLVARLRERLGASLAGRAMDCFYCTSLWVAAPIALWITTSPLSWLMAWFALSGAACLCDRVGHPEVVIQPMPEATEGDSDGVLREAPRRVPEQPAAFDGPDDDPSGHAKH